MSFKWTKIKNLGSLYTDCMYLNNFGCVFYILKLSKTLRRKSHEQPIEFKAYPHDASLCEVALIKLYLNKTTALRHDVDSMFLISYAAPQKPVSSRIMVR